MSEHEPSVSITSSFLTNTFCAPIRLATMNKQAVTVEGKPQGIFAIIVTENNNESHES